MAEYIVNTDVEESRYKAMGADYAAYFNNKTVTLLGNPVRENIVRCRDCRHYIAERGYCIYRKPLMFTVRTDGFCAWGERKEGE